MDKRELRNKFFEEHTVKGIDGIPKITTHPHNLFEWIYGQIENCYTPKVSDQMEQLCECDAPLIRTGDKGGEYCGLCEKDLD